MLRFIGTRPEGRIPRRGVQYIMGAWVHVNFSWQTHLCMSMHIIVTIIILMIFLKSTVAIHNNYVGVMFGAETKKLYTQLLYQSNVQ